MVKKSIAVVSISLLAVSFGVSMMAPKFFFYDETEEGAGSQEQSEETQMLPADGTIAGSAESETDTAEENAAPPSELVQDGSKETAGEVETVIAKQPETEAQGAAGESRPEEERAGLLLSSTKPENQETMPEETVPAPTESAPDPVEMIYSVAKSEEIIAEMEMRGSCGRLFIPGVGVDVAIFNVTMYNSKISQPVVDAKDSVAYMTDCVPWWGFPLVGDHVNQGFEGITRCVQGETVAYMHFGTHVDSYICTKIFLGYNNGSIIDFDGNPIKGTNPGGLCMYTCNADDTITIVFWQPLVGTHHSQS